MYIRSRTLFNKGVNLVGNESSDKSIAYSTSYNEASIIEVSLRAFLLNVAIDERVITALEILSFVMRIN